MIEAREQLQAIMSNVISLEGNHEEASKLSMAENILHQLHSMKGNSRAAGVITAESLCQLLESAILSLKRKKELLSPAAADAFHNAIDILYVIINKVESGDLDYNPPSLPYLLSKLKALDERQRLQGSSESMTAVPDRQSEKTAKELTGTSKRLPEEIKATQSQSEPATELGIEAVNLDIGRLDGSAADSGRSSKTAIQDKSASTRIALWKLDKILRESEEMLILKQISDQHLNDLKELKYISKRLYQVSQQITRCLKEEPESIGSESELHEISMKLNSAAQDLRQAIRIKTRRQQTEQRLCSNMVDGFIDSVKSLLMQDFSSLLLLVPKIVRDLSRELKKEINLEVFGSEIEIDRRILEEIKDPLIHLIRNSIDHGIEPHEMRLKAGKAAKASLKIGARHDESGGVQLIVSDDGNGIKIEKLKEAAVKEGEISTAEAAAMSDSDAIELMYRSSVSTSDALTEISGRGLGMAIVRNRIHDLGGRIIVETEQGKGTSFVLQLPTKLSTFRGIQVSAGNQSFIIPTLNVHYAGRILRSEIKQKGNRNVAMVNSQLLSVQELSRVLQIDCAYNFKSRAAQDYKQILVLESSERKAGFLVDEILQEQEVLVRGLSYPLLRVPNISGATILGSGQVVPVLNISDLLESSTKAQAADRQLTEELRREQERRQRLSKIPIFLIDHHFTSQVMLKALLETEGYLVQTFENNEAALEELGHVHPLLLLKCSELHDGSLSGLTHQIRQAEGLQDLPIVFFGRQPMPEGNDLSLKQGGNAYFNKSDFDRNQILEIIEKLT